MGDQRAFASVPIAACRKYGIDEELVNFSGSAAAWPTRSPLPARMVTTLVYGCAAAAAVSSRGDVPAGGQGGAVVIEV